jgi:hypothetical protein
MPKPVTVPTWATTTLYATNPDPTMVGQPTKADPASIAAEGWKHITRPNPRFLNYWQNEVGSWLSWINTDVFSTEGGSYVLLDAFALSGGSLTLNLEVTHPAGEQFFENGELVVTATGEITFQSGSELTLASGSTILGDPVFGGGTWTWAAPQIVDTTTLTFSGSGHARYRPFAAADDNATYGINNGDTFYIPNQGADHVYTLSTTGAGTGSRMAFTAEANTGSFSVQIVTAEGTYFLRNVGGSTNLRYLEVEYFSGAWHTRLIVPVP